MMNTKNSVKAIGLLSGGLDSTLAVKLMIEQGVEVTAVNFVSPFCTCTRKGCKHEAGKVAKQFRIPVKIIAVGEDYIEMIKHPKHGYGSNMNPCIDCRIFMFKKAKTYMEEIGARFIFTGEVLGQRPMSQHRRAMNLIEKESGLQRLILRPLSAKLLPLTIPEEHQWVDREKLLDIQGRRRLPQMDLAKKIGVKDYPCPGGGCRLTDPQFAKRLKEALDHGEDTIRDIQLLKYGRHVRLPSGAKVIVGRNEEENKTLLQFLNSDDIALEVIGTGSPIVFLQKQKDIDDIRQAAAICIHYSDTDNRDDVILKIKHGYDHEEILKYVSL
jgi:tRNA U34 2-thiouridine synthase MnmA/TrmU